MKEFTKDNLDGLRKDINKALAEVEKKHGIDFRLGAITYGAKNFKVTLRAIAGGLDSYEAANFKKCAGKLGIPENWFGKKFKEGRKEYTITGINTRAYRRPIKIEDQYGKKYKCDVPYLKRHIKESLSKDFGACNSLGIGLGSI